MSTTQSGRPGSCSAMHGPRRSSALVSFASRKACRASITARSRSVWDAPPLHAAAVKTGNRASRARIAVRCTRGNGNRRPNGDLFAHSANKSPGETPLRVRAAAGEAGARLRTGARALAGCFLLALGLGLLRNALLLLGLAEDLVLGRSLEELHELLGFDGLALQQDPGDPVHHLAPLDEDVLGGLVGLLDDSPDLVVDLAGDLVRVVRLRGELAAEERLGTV